MFTVRDAFLAMHSGAESAPPPRPLDRRNFRASYCSHRDHVGRVVFDPIYFGLLWDMNDRATIDACLAVKRAMGVDAIQLCVQGGYPDYAAGKTFDFRTRPEVYAGLCDYIHAAGFTPIILIGTADGETYQEIYNGTMRAVLEATKHLAPFAWWCPGYEVNADRGGGFTAKQTDDALGLIRSVVGDEGLILLWLQPGRCTPATYYGSDPNHKPGTPTWCGPIELKWIYGDPAHPENGAWIEASDPYGGDEQGAYYKSNGREIDGLWYQTPHGNDGPAYLTGGPGLDGWGQPRYLDRVIEIADRFLAPGTPMPGAVGHKSDNGHGGFNLHTSAVAPSISAPYWFYEYRARGPVQFIIGETVPYEYTRGECSDEAVAACCRLMESIGAPVAGCYRA